MGHTKGAKDEVKQAQRAANSQYGSDIRGDMAV